MTDHLDDLSRARSIGPACVWAEDATAPNNRLASSVIVGGLKLNCANGRVATCIGGLWRLNIHDLLWVNEVLNRFGHRVPHPGDDLGKGGKS